MSCEVFDGAFVLLYCIRKLLIRLVEDRLSQCVCLIRQLERGLFIMRHFSTHHNESEFRVPVDDLLPPTCLPLFIDVHVTLFN